SGASSRQRLLQFVPDLAGLGWEITVRPLHRPAYLEALYAGRGRSPLAIAADYARRLGVLRDAGRHDLIWVERELLPWLPWGLAALAAESPVRLVTIGAAIDLPGVPREARPWSESTEAAELARCHVGIMPLPDDPWERGKCGYKLVQYMASGLPVVASAVGANRTIVEPGITGCFAEGEERWLTALRILRDDPDLRLRLGAAGRARALARYSRPAVLPRLAELLAAAASRA